MASSARTILLVDDDDSVRMSYAALLEDDGYRVVEAVSVGDARARIADTEVDAVVLDLHLRDGVGTSLAADVRARHPRAAIVLLSGAAASAGVDVDSIVEKGEDPAVLSAEIERAIAKRTTP